jgi:long-chain acyl-CoA synthetase
VAQPDWDPEEIEAHYRKSAFLSEVCVWREHDAQPQTTGRLFAVVVPDMEAIRRRRIVNVGDLLRFEMEGLSIDLPREKRVLAFAIWFEALPRDPAGRMERGEIERRVREKQQRAEHGHTHAPVEDWARGANPAEVVTRIRLRAGGKVVEAESNLEIDLGLDSMARVELLTELERELGLCLPLERAHEVLTVSQLVHALEKTGVDTRSGPPEDPWALLLHDLPPASDPVLRSVFRHHVLKAVVYVFLRTVRLLMPAITVRGLEHVPPRGPYIISPNHQSYFDPFFICSVLPYRIVSDVFAVGATEYFETPAMAWVARQLNLVAVDPDSNLVPAMKAAAFGLKLGKVLLLFPEGERSIDGTVKHFKKGAAILSRHVNVPVVPVALRGAFRVWPRNRAFNWRALVPWSRHRIEIIFGTPMRFASQGYAAGAAELQHRVTELWRSPEHGRDDEKSGDAAGEQDA